ncbi:arginine--tRNA ligase, partial [bacterium]|nr:arginine--tRNA ligase [bacterium]
QIAHVVGIGAIKYADLSQNRTSSYDFDWDRMLAFDGNTGPYLQYTYARIQSLIRKSKTRTDFEPTANIILDTDTEKNLCLNLTLFPQVLIKTMEAHKPNTLTEYLFELAQKFNTLYNSMPIIKETSPIFSSRLIICQKTAFILKTGLNLLGINVVDRM